MCRYPSAHATNVMDYSRRLGVGVQKSWASKFNNCGGLFLQGKWNKAYVLNSIILVGHLYLSGMRFGVDPKMGTKRHVHIF